MKGMQWAEATSLCLRQMLWPHIANTDTLYFIAKCSNFQIFTVKPADLLLCPVEHFSRMFRIQLLVLMAAIFCPHRISLDKYKGWPCCCVSSSRVKNTNKNKRLHGVDREADTRSPVFVTHETDYPHTPLKSSEAKQMCSLLSSMDHLLRGAICFEILDPAVGLLTLGQQTA